MCRAGEFVGLRVKDITAARRLEDFGDGGPSTAARQKPKLAAKQNR
jgi:hypothetical protein